MPRLFSGIEIPADIAQRLGFLHGGLENARWIDPENFHITLRFIGDVDGAMADRFDDALAKIRLTPFELTLDGLGVFGGKKPRSVWAGVQPNATLDGLFRANDLAAQKAGLMPEARNFHPHVTLARLRGAKSAPVASYLAQNGAFLSEAFPVSRFVLFSARESRGGGPYIVERSYPLGQHAHSPLDLVEPGE